MIICRSTNTAAAPLRAGHAFTLIEILVVVAVIALLLSLLLPSLSAAREQTRSAVCAGHLRQMGMGMHAYTSEHREWLAGPNTSGLHLLADGGGYERGDDVDRSPQAPTYNLDWISPTMGRILNLPDPWRQRLRAIFNAELRCPSNRDLYASLFSPGGDALLQSWVDGGDLQYASYSSILAFHAKGIRCEGKVVIESPDERWPFTRDQIDMLHLDDVAFPAHYVPKISMVGDASRKVYVTEGARYITSAGPSFNDLIYQNDGGNFMTLGPALTRRVRAASPYHRDVSTGALSAQARRYAYRHRGDRINAVFFDGHLETLVDHDATKVGMYLPRDSVILNAAQNYDPRDTDGQVIGY